MRKLLVLSFLCMFPVFTFAENKGIKPKLDLNQCKEILGAAMFNGALEEVCGFNGGVKEGLKEIYDVGQCRTIVPQSTVESLAKDVLEDSRMRYKAFGEKVFCDANLKGYTDLMDVK